jgi:hypothetical protein
MAADTPILALPRACPASAQVWLGPRYRDRPQGVYLAGHARVERRLCLWSDVMWAGGRNDGKITPFQ